IYSTEDVRRLLAVPDSHYPPDCPLSPDTMRTLLLVLYGTGLRLGEATRLKHEDADFKNGVLRFDTARYQPRLHDFRHTFAVTRLLTWYRDGKEVQRMLPLLSTYLGHCSVDETSVYLQMTRELLQEANRRFERYVFAEVSNG